MSLIALTLCFATSVIAEPEDRDAIAKQQDNRVKIVLTEPERAVIFGEMRYFLIGTQQIIAAIANDNMKKVSEVAETLGPKMMRNIAKKTIRPKLPLGFKKFGHSLHNNFDMIAQNAKDFGDSQLILKQLGAALEKCVACHAAYQITIEGNQ